MSISVSEFLRLAEHLSATNTAITEMLRRGANSGVGHTMALRQLWTLTMREAQTQLYADAFLGLMACLGIATVLVPLMRKVASVADAH